MVFTVDTVDREAGTIFTGIRHAAPISRSYYHYIVDEAVPHQLAQYLRKVSFVAVGHSLGATHAGIVAPRRPDLFGGRIAMSGIYDASYYTGGWMNSNGTTTHPSFRRICRPTTTINGWSNERAPIFCVGQGAWSRTASALVAYGHIFQKKGIRMVRDFWGYDVSHDWDWWKKQIRYFLPQSTDGSGNR